MKNWFSTILRKRQTAMHPDGGKSTSKGDPSQEVQEGLALRQAKNYQMAIKCFERALAMDPNRDDVWNSMGLCHSDCNEISEAISCYYKALDINPQCGLAWYNLGLALVEQKDTDKAIDAYRKAANATDSIDDYYRACALTNQGRLEMDANHLEAALKSLRRAVQMDPHLSQAKLFLVMALAQMKAFKEAKEVIASISDSRFKGFWDVTSNGDVQAGIRRDGKMIYAFEIKREAAIVGSSSAPTSERFANDKNLADAYYEKASKLNGANHDKREAAQFYDQAIDIYERLVEKEGHKELTGKLAATNLCRALIADGVRCEEAVQSYDRAIRNFERAGDTKMDSFLALAYLQKGWNLTSLGNLSAAIGPLQHAIEKYNELAVHDGGSEVAEQLAKAYFTKANVSRDLSDLHGAIQLFDQAIAIRERLVEREGRRDLANDFAAAIMNKGNVLMSLRDFRGAIALHDRAIAIRKGLVENDPRPEFRGDLAKTLYNKGIALSNLGDHKGALSLFDCGIAIQEQLVKKEGGQEWAGDLTSAIGFRATIAKQLSDAK